MRKKETMDKCGHINLDTKAKGKVEGYPLFMNKHKFVPHQESSRVHMHIKECIFFCTLRWMPEKMEQRGNRSDMGLWHLEKSPNDEKKRRWVQIQRPLLSKIPTFCLQIYGEQTKVTKLFLGKIKGSIMRTKSRCLYLIIFDSQLVQLYKEMKQRTTKKEKKMEMDEEEKKGWLK